MEVFLTDISFLASNITVITLERCKKILFQMLKTRTDDKTQIAEEEKKRKQMMGLITEETVEEGSVKLAVIKSYVRAASTKFAIICVLSLAMFIATQTFTNIWLSWWSNDQIPMNSTVPDRDLLNLRLGVYGALGVAQSKYVVGGGVWGTGGGTE